MRKFLLSFLLIILVVVSVQVQAACSGTQYAGSFTITAVTPFVVRDVNSCTLLQSASVLISPTGIMTAPLASGSFGGQFTLTPVTNGTVTMTVATPGYATITETVTVNLGTQAGFSQ